MADQEVILIVDDEPEIVAAISYLPEEEGFTTVSAADGLQALGIAFTQALSLVILDVAMPRMDGFDTLAQLRLHAPDLPIVMLTVREDQSSKLRGFELGADDYVTKPFGARELIARVRAQLRRRTARSTFAYNDSRIAIDATTCTVIVDGDVYHVKIGRAHV